MTVLIAGAGGLVGSSLVKEFSKKTKEDVVGLFRNDLNLLNRSATFSYIESLRPRIVVDAAAKVGGIGANSNYPVEFLSENLQIQTNLIDACHAASVEKVIFLGSSCIYPRDCKQPIKEEFILTGPLEPTNSAYALAKISGLELIKSYRKQYKHKWITVMPTNLYGPNDNFDLENSHVLPALIRKFVEATNNRLKTVTLWGTGSAVREFLYVEDLARAIIFCTENYDSDDHINIGTGIGISIKQLAEKISEITGFSGEIVWDKSKPDGMPVKVLDVGRIKSLGWSPTFSFEDGLIKTVNWYRENRLND
jgi:GDP-L-fucose synthase